MFSVFALLKSNTTEECLFLQHDALSQVSMLCANMPKTLLFAAGLPLFTTYAKPLPTTMFISRKVLRICAVNLKPWPHATSASKTGVLSGSKQ